MANQVSIIVHFYRGTSDCDFWDSEMFSRWFQPAAHWSGKHIVKIVSQFLFEFLSIHHPCTWSQHAWSCVFHVLQINSWISPDESTWRHVQAVAVFLCKHNSECLSPICCTSIEFRISLASIQMALGRVRFDVRICVSLILNYTDWSKNRVCHVNICRMCICIECCSNKYIICGWGDREYSFSIR